MPNEVFDTSFNTSFETVFYVVRSPMFSTVYPLDSKKCTVLPLFSIQMTCYGINLSVNISLNLKDGGQSSQQMDTRKGVIQVNSHS